jgi:HSP20 family molecular chaperone IbpA
MPEVVVHKEHTPFFEEVGKAFDAIRHKAFELFDRRGRKPGLEIEDWLAAERELFNVPEAEMSETDTEFRFAVSVNGFEESDIHVTAESDRIVVAADIEKMVDGVCQSRSLFRTFAVGSECPEMDTAKVTAVLDQGVLKIVAPKSVAAVTKVPVAIDRPTARAVEASPEKKNGDTEAARAAAA